MQQVAATASPAAGKMDYGSYGHVAPAGQPLLTGAGRGGRSSGGRHRRCRRPDAAQPAAQRARPRGRGGGAATGLPSAAGTHFSET